MHNRLSKRVGIASDDEDNLGDCRNFCSSKTARGEVDENQKISRSSAMSKSAFVPPWKSEERLEKGNDCAYCGLRGID